MNGDGYKDNLFDHHFLQSEEKETQRWVNTLFGHFKVFLQQQSLTFCFV